jgi:hypothetical protein
MAWRIADRALDRPAANYFDPLPRVAVGEPGLDRIKEALLDRLTGMFRQSAAHRGSGTKRNGTGPRKKEVPAHHHIRSAEGFKLVSPKNYATVALPKGGNTWAACQQKAIVAGALGSIPYMDYSITLNNSA